MSVVCLLRVEAPLAAWLAWATPCLPSRLALLSTALPPPQPPTPPPCKEFRVRVAPGSRAKSIMRILI